MPSQGFAGDEFVMCYCWAVVPKEELWVLLLRVAVKQEGQGELDQLVAPGR